MRTAQVLSSAFLSRAAQGVRYLTAIGRRPREGAIADSF